MIFFRSTTYTVIRLEYYEKYPEMYLEFNFNKFLRNFFLLFHGENFKLLE